MTIGRKRQRGSSLRNHITEPSSDKRMFQSERENNYWLCVCQVLHGMRFPCGDLSNEQTEFCRIAWAGITCCDVVQHRDRNRIAGAIVDEPADCRIVIDAIEGDRMAVFDEDGTEYVEIDADDATLLGKDQWIVGGQPQFVGRWIQDEVGHRVGDQGGLRMGHATIYSTALEGPLQR